MVRVPEYRRDQDTRKRIVHAKKESGSIPIQDRERAMTFRRDSNTVPIERAQCHVLNDGKQVNDYGFQPIGNPIDDGDT